MSLKSMNKKHVVTSSLPEVFIVFAIYAMRIMKQIKINLTSYVFFVSL